MTRAELEDLFRGERRRFAARFPKAARAELVVDDKKCPARGRPCGYRDVALATQGEIDPQVVIAARATRWSKARVTGILRHELGHVADPTPRAPGAEQRADDIAEAVTGQRVNYDRRAVQTTGPGTHPRPRRLHR